MTDRTNYLTAVLDGDYRTDDAEHIIKSISMIKGVLTVEINVTDPGEYMAMSQAKNDLRQKLWDILK